LKLRRIASWDAFRDAMTDMRVNSIGAAAGSRNNDAED
jgi:hypothetical protein